MNYNELVQEYIKCLEDIPYYAKKYCKAFDQTRGGYVPLEVFPRQADLLNQLKNERYNIVLKPRQAGVSTVSALYCAHLLLFATEDSPQRVLIVANKRDTAREFLDKMKGYIASAPEWLGLHKPMNKSGDDLSPYLTNNSNLIVLTNGSMAKAVGTSPDALRGYTPTVLVLDEAAFIQGADALWTGAGPSLSTGGRALFISTPNGQDPLYHRTYMDSLKGESDFKIFDMYWWQDPRFNKDLSFLKSKIIETVGDDGTKIREVVKERCYADKLPDGTWDFDHARSLMANKWEPTSAWFEAMCKTYNGDERKIAQELKTVFTGSGDNVIHDDYIMQQQANNMLPITTDGFDNNIWIWEQPISGHQYILGCDVSRGNADDYSCFTILDMMTGNQVVEWVGKCPPDKLGEIVNEWGRKYQAYAAVDITGGMGESTVLKLQELNYPWLHYTSNAKNGAVEADTNKIAGFILSSKNRTLVIAVLEEAIRTGRITIRSKRAVDEMTTFVYINGRPDHAKGKHDDILISLAIALYVFEYSFKDIKKYQEQTRAMLDAWLNSTSEQPVIKVGTSEKDDYNNSDWIFG